MDSIPSGELNTAKRLYDDIEIHATHYMPSPLIEYVRVESSDELIQCIAECQQRATNNDVLPMLHIECHGNEDGLEMADGSVATWLDLKRPITDLNIATHLNLMIAVAACTGAALAKVVQMSDRAPFWGLVGPTDELTARDLELAYRDFYITLLKTKSPAKAFDALDTQTKAGLFWRKTSQGLFQDAWALYKAEYCGETDMKPRFERMRQRAKQLSIEPIPSEEDMKSRLISQEPSAFELFRNTFFMCDLFPDHFERFPVKYVP